MADEIKKIIEIDASNSIRSIKDYKQHIDNLKASLLGLNQNSQQYKQITEQIQTEQTKLDNILSIGTRQTDAAKGSYNQLVATMKQLKEAWAATANEAERAQLGAKILSINNQLKDLEESTGDFSRSIGNYGQAFQSAFQLVTSQLRDTDGLVGVLGDDIGKLMPLILSTTRAATTGIAGVKAALARTGIGLAIVAVGELLFHWREFADFVGISEQQISNFGTQTLNVLEAITKGLFGVGTSIYGAIIAQVDNAMVAVRAFGRVFNDILEGNFNVAIDHAAKGSKLVMDEVIKGFTTKPVYWYKVGEDAAGNLFDGIRARLDKEKPIEPKVKMPKISAPKAEEEEKQDVDGLKQAVEAEQEFLNDLKIKAYQNYQDKIKEIDQQRKDERFVEQFEEYESEQEKLDAVYAINKKAIEDRLALQEQMLDSNMLSKEKELEVEQQHQEALKELWKLTYEYNAQTKKATDKAAEESTKRREKHMQDALKGTKGIFSQLSELSEEGSEEQKAFAIMETVINTYDAAMSAYKSLSGIPVVGPALGAAAAAVAVASGIQQVNKIKSTTKENASVNGDAAATAPQVEQSALVTPLLNEESDLTRMSNIPVQQTTETQNIKVYVTESDISDATHKAQVRDQDSTF